MQAPPELDMVVDAALGLGGASLRLREFLNRGQVGERAMYAADLALEELGANILRYAFAPGQGPSFTFRARLGPAHVVLAFEDEGAAFDPTAALPPARAASLESSRIGGLGIHMVRRLTQQMTYSRELHRNCLQVIIAREPPAPSLPSTRSSAPAGLDS